MQTFMGLVFQFFDWLQKKFKLAYVTFVIRIGGVNAGVTDIDCNHHYKARDFAGTSREDLLRELSEIHELEKEFD